MNILNIKQKNKTPYTLIDKQSCLNDDSNYNIYNFNSISKYPIASKEWLDSLYSYNSNYYKLSCFRNNLGDCLYQSYLNANLYHLNAPKIKKIILNAKKYKIRPKLPKFYLEKVLSSKPEIKYTHNKAIITLHIYNRLRQNYLACNIIKNFSVIKDIYMFYLSIKLKKLSYDIKFPKLKTDKTKFSILKTELYFKKSIKTLYLNQILWGEINKIKNIYLSFKGLGLSHQVEQIYDKSAETDIINHKSLYFNSDIITRFILSKALPNIRVVLRQVLKKKFLSKILIFQINKKKNNLLVNKENAISLLKYKAINGIELKIAGRLTRRFIAQRAIYKIYRKGCIKNIYSSYLGVSCKILRNNLRYNLQYTKITGINRIGSFGIKCSVSSC